MSKLNPDLDLDMCSVYIGQIQNICYIWDFFKGLFYTGLGFVDGTE
jgi:hypothetical protein